VKVKKRLISCAECESLSFDSDIGQRFGDRQKFVAREASLTIREEEMAVAEFWQLRTGHKSATFCSA
jgi:hypothetical protein